VPLSTNPDDLIPFVLELDAERFKDEPEKAPTFFLRFLSCRKLLEAQRLYREATETPDDEKANATMNAVLAIGVGGWRNLPVEYDAARPGDVLDAADLLTPGEKEELARAVCTKPRLTELERKNSVSRSSSPAGSSANTAPATSAATSPPNTTATGFPAPNVTGTGATPVTGGASSC
jgi:hypothetical protein